MPWLTSFTPYFVHPALAAGGALLVASPIIIHLINRMRYRRVRFAAMEFLLASEQKNRRRLLLEQLLLLLLRILIVVGLVALVARMILDPSQLSLFRGAKAHHVVLLDDSGSMRDRWGDKTGFSEAIAVAKRLAGDSATRPNTERFSLLLLSRPDDPVFTQEDVNDDFVARLETKLESLPSQVTYRSLDLIAGLEAARKLLAEDRATVKQLHVLSDFRQRDWVSQEAISGAVKALDESKILVNLIRTVPERHANVAVTDLSGDVQVAAAGVPLRLHTAVKNYGKEVAKEVRLSVFLDGQKLAMSLPFDKIDAGKEVEREFDLVIDTVKKHIIQVTLEPDAIDADNSRWLAVDIPPKNSVLIIDGNPGGEDGSYVEAALASNPQLTGFAPVIETVDFLRRQPLHPYQCIYLLNVPEMPADAIEPLKDFVSNGGGLTWFVGDLVKPTFYNDKLYEEGKGLFPVPLGPARRELVRDDTNPGPDLLLSKHPVFEKLFGQDNPFIELVELTYYQPVPESWPRDDNERKDGVRTIGTLRNKQPLVFEHTFGQGRIITFLTSAGSEWTNWPKSVSYVITQLELEKYIARRDRVPESRVVGQPLDFALNPSEYLGEIEIRSPKQPDIPVRLTASRKQDAPKSDGAPQSPKSESPKSESPKSESPKPETPKPESPKPEPPKKDDPHAPLVEDFDETEDPGVYSVTLAKSDDTRDERLYAYNVPAEEGDLELATVEDIRKRIGPDVRVEIQDAAAAQAVQSNATGDEGVFRKLLLAALALVFMGEQLMACRLSFHPKQAAAA